MKISVMNRSNAVSFTNEYTSSNNSIAIISITDNTSPKAPLSSYFSNVLYLYFNDEETVERGGMTQNHAMSLRTFIEGLDQTIEHLIVHCDGGVSRSAGTAAALGLILNKDDTFIYNSPKYCPNSNCYRKVLEAFDYGFNPDVFTVKNEAQLELWRREHLD